MAKKTALGQRGDPVARIAGHNVKLGEGGIREIEFLVQTLQMVWGGRDPTLRIKPTLPAMARLAATGHLGETARTQLGESVPVPAPGRASHPDGERPPDP